MNNLRLFFSAGEPSGDLHAAHLIDRLRSLEPETECIGFGGPKMQSSNCKLLADLTQHAVMWLKKPLANYFLFRNFLKQAEAVFASEKIDAVILVDYPGFNWHVAKCAKKYGIPVYYFMPPQIWSWASWRVKKMKRYVDKVFSPLPFEQRWFEKHGIETDYIGHPFFEETRQYQPDTAFMESFRKQCGDEPILTLLPGSRDQEVHGNLADILFAVEIVRAAVPKVRPVFAAFKETQAAFIRKMLEQRGLMIPVFVGKTPELLRLASCCLAVSGSVSLESLACNKPAVIYYRVGRLPFFIQRFFRRTPSITLVNLLELDRHRNETTGETPVFYGDAVRFIPAEADVETRSKMLFPEFLTCTDKSKEAAACLIDWLSTPESIQQSKERLASLLQEVDSVSSPLTAAAKKIIG
ncbi:MAG: hypothetical protein FWE67_00210 [Planctomycetaceae bacterium]|nr:hypothetical protein [Planctomycetaceae bacterium]